MLRYDSSLTFCVTAVAAAVLAGCGGGGSDGAEQQAASTEFVRKVTACQSGDKPEAALQGQVPAAMRAQGFSGFNCNLSLIGQLQGEGGHWSAAAFADQAGHRCMYHSTAMPGPSPFSPPGLTVPARVNPGVPVIDISNPAQPVRTMSLTTPAMMDPHESLRINARRQILIADNGTNGGATGDSTIDIYDLSGDCRSPQLLASIPVGTGSGIAPTEAKGHEGNISPDGLTYYVGDTTARRYHAIDITNTTNPKLVASWSMDELANLGAPNVHGLSVSEDGNRMYGAIISSPNIAKLSDPATTAANGFAVFDTSEVQQRKPNAQIKLISKALFKDGSVAQHTIPIKIGSKPYIVMVDEGGAGGTTSTESVTAACKAGLTPFPLARLFDLSDEKNPKQVAKLGLETHNVSNCDAILPDIAGLSVFTYGSHYCSVDNRENATALACSYFNSGIRVFDIRDPKAVKEIAYYNPPGTKTAVPGSHHVLFGQWKANGPDWCSSRLDFDYANKQLVTMCQDNGALIMKFAANTWPFAESVASKDQN